MCRVTISKLLLVSALSVFVPRVALAGPEIVNAHFETVDGDRHYVVTLYNSNRWGGTQSATIYYRFNYACKARGLGYHEERSCQGPNDLCEFGIFRLEPQDHIELTMFVVPEEAVRLGFAGSISIQWIPSDNPTCSSCYSYRTFDEPGQ